MQVIPPKSLEKLLCPSHYRQKLDYPILQFYLHLELAASTAPTTLAS